MDPLLAEIQSSLKETIPAETPAPNEPTQETPKTAEPVAETVPTQETPVADAPAPVADPVIVDTSIDISKILQEQSGGRLTSAEDLTKILQERDEFETRLKQAPELDDYTLKLSQWRKQGFDVELFHAIHDLPIDELSSEDKVKASLKLQNPEWDDEGINIFIQNKYGILAPDADGYDEQKARYGKMQLDVDAKGADQELRKLQGLTAFSQEDEQAVAQAEGDRQKAWSAGLPKIAADFKKVSLALDAEGKHIFDYVPTQQQTLKVIESLQKAILNAPVAYDENGIKAVNDLFRKEFRDQNFNEIVRAAAARMASIEKEANIKKVHNPSAAKEPTPILPTPKSGEQETVDAIGGLMDRPGRR